MNSRRAWLMFGLAVAAYFVAVLQRSSLSVAGVEATDRFAVQAVALSSLAVVQLAVYAALQVPVGVVLDRVGPRVLLTLGASLMVVGQVTLALAPDLGVAIGGRVLVGAGDAMTFISAIRLLAEWFSGRRLPFVTQLLGTSGQFGQLLSAVPFALVLHTFGWTPSYLSAAAVSVLVVAVLVLLGGNRTRTTRAPAPYWRESLGHLRESLARPGTQLGFWSHFVTQSSGTVFALLWGFPFLSIGLGYGPTAAATLLSLIVLIGAVVGPVLGILTARFPMRRSNLVLAIVSFLAIVWTVFLGWPGPPPIWLVLVLLVAMAVGGPASLIGLDFARTFNPMRSFGSASGLVNVGGFLASFVMMLLIGVVLDAVDRLHGGTGAPDELYSLESFRIAFLVQYPVVGAGVVMLLATRARTRRKLHADEGISVAPLWVALVRRWRHRRTK